MMIAGAGGGGGKGGGGSSRTPTTAKDSLDARQYATVIDLISEGEIEGLVDGDRSIYLNNTPLQNDDGSYNFEGVTVEFRTGTQSQAYIPLAAGVEDVKPVGLTVTKDVPVVRTIDDMNVDAVRVTIAVPALQKINPNTGDTYGARVELKIWIQYPGGPFIEALPSGTDTISGRTADEYPKDYLIQLDPNRPAGAVNIKVERITPDSTTQLRSNAFIWKTYTEIIWAKLRYPNSALAGLRIDAEQFSSIPSRSYLIKGVKVQIPAGVQVDQRTGRIIYPDGFVWDGTFAAAQWTTCPAWILWDLLVSDRYGVGQHVDASKLDRWSFYAASRYANELIDDGYGGQEARFSCCINLQTAQDVYKLLNELMSICRCIGYWSAGGLTISQDRPSDPAYLFTLANVSEEGFSYSGSSLKTRPNVAVVSYMDIGRYDENGIWRDGLKDTAYEVVEDVEAIDTYGAIRAEVAAMGCTSRGQANRLGRWLLFTEKHEGEVCSFTAMLDAGQLVRPGQVILVSDPVRAGSRRGGRISAATASAVTVDDTTGTDLSYGSGSLLSVLLSDGTIEQREVSSIAGAVVTVQAPFSAAPLPGSMWVLESTTLQASTWRVIAIAERDGIGYEITALAHDPTKYAYVESGDQLVPRDTTNLNEIPPPPSGLEVLAVTLQDGSTTKELQYELNGRVAIKVTFRWQGAQGVKRFRVKWRHEDGNFATVTVQGTTFDIEDAKPGAYEIQVSAVSASGVLFSEPALATYSVEGLGDAPGNVSGLSATAISEGLALLTWTQAADLDVRLGGRVIIRHDPRPIATAEWSGSAQIVDAVAGSSTQKQVPLLPGTYLVKFEDFLGNRSEAAAAAEMALPQYESRLLLSLYADASYSDDFYTTGVQWNDEVLASPYSGQAVNCMYSEVETALVITGGDYVDSDYVDSGYAQVATMEPYVAFDYWEPIYCSGDGQAEYVFSETLDMGAVYDVNFRRYVLIRPLSFSTLFDAAPEVFDERLGLFDGAAADGINITTYLRATNDNPSGTPTWGPWVEIINGVAQGRAFQVKAVLSTNNSAVGIAVEDLQVIPEVIRRTASSASPITASSASFDAPFYDINAVTITPQQLLSTQRYVLSGVSRTGFTVSFFDEDTPIETPYSYTATGYGRGS